MITIIIGVILIYYVLKKYDVFDEILVGVGITAGIVMIICGILVPMAGFTEPTEEVMELMPLRLEQVVDKEYYLEYENGYYHYAYDNSEEYNLGGGAYQNASVYKNSSVKVYESENCTTPILKIYRSKSKISWYSLAGMWSDTEYVFYIPVGTNYVSENK